MYIRKLTLSLAALQLWVVFAVYHRQTPLQILIADPDTLSLRFGPSSNVPAVILQGDQQPAIQKSDPVTIQNTLQSAWKEVSYAIETMQKH